MAVDLATLQSLGRDELIDKAQGLGIRQASKLTRLELIDEILRVSIEDETQRKAARGLLGRARDLVSRVMERKRQPTPAGDAPPSAPEPPPPRKPVPTIRLARVYFNQGLLDQATDTLRRVLERHPDDREAKMLLRDWTEHPSPRQGPGARLKKNRKLDFLTGAGGMPSSQHAAKSTTNSADGSSSSLASRSSAADNHGAGSNTDLLPTDRHALFLKPAQGVLNVSWEIPRRDFYDRLLAQPLGQTVLELLAVSENVAAGPQTTIQRFRLASCQGKRLVAWKGSWMVGRLVWEHAEGREVIAVAGPVGRTDGDSEDETGN